MLTHLTRFGRVHGIDFDHEAAGYCTERGLDHVAQASATKLPFPDMTFDVVTMLDVLEHIRDEGGAVAELMRVLRPGGLALIAVPAYRLLWGAQDEVSQHVRRYTAKQLRATVEGAGLRVRRLTYFNTILFPPIAAIRLFRRAVPATRTQVSDFNFPAPGPVNGVLAAIFGSEAAIVSHTGLPFGVSILCLAERPAAA